MYINYQQLLLAFCLVHDTEHESENHKKSQSKINRKGVSDFMFDMMNIQCLQAAEPSCSSHPSGGDSRIVWVV